ncbi:phosphatase PAP2 family protein [Pseudomonas sediminis]|nr:phosphatase PAP2 family protein [Pseudomonas sediminis]MDG9757092.1 phosphatase PAP2 family protein [Pseudomonas sediminis]
MSSTFINRHWQPRAMLVCHVVAVVLLVSWLWQPTRELWNVFDVWLFKLLNDPVHAGGLWAHIWAIGSMRPVDAGVGVVMLAVMLKADLVFTGPQVRRALFAFLVALIVMLLMRVLFADLVEYMGWQHASPSLVVEGSARLTEMFPAWEERWDLKDSASRSFPGDHASVLLIWAYFMSFFARGWRLLLVWAITVTGILPRLVAGAHWGGGCLCRRRIPQPAGPGLELLHPTGLSRQRMAGEDYPADHLTPGQTATAGPHEHRQRTLNEKVGASSAREALPSFAFASRARSNRLAPNPHPPRGGADHLPAVR